MTSYVSVDAAESNESERPITFTCVHRERRAVIPLTHKTAHEREPAARRGVALWQRRHDLGEEWKDFDLKLEQPLLTRTRHNLPGIC